MVGAEAGREGKAKGGRETVRQMVNQRERLDGREVGIQDEER